MLMKRDYRTSPWWIQNPVIPRYTHMGPAGPGLLVQCSVSMQQPTAVSVLQGLLGVGTLSVPCSDTAQVMPRLSSLKSYSLQSHRTLHPGVKVKGRGLL